MIIIYPMLISQSVSENIIPGIAKTLETYIIANAKDSIITNAEIRKSYNFKIKGSKLIATENINLTSSSELNLNEERSAAQIKQDEIEAAWKSKADYDKAERERIQKQIEKDEFDFDKAKRDAESEEEKRKLELQWKKDEERRKEEKHKLDIDLAKAKAEKEAAEAELKKQEKEKEEKKKAQAEETKRATTTVKMQDNKTLSLEPTFLEIEIVDIYGNRRTESIGIKVLGFRVKSDIKLSSLILNDMKLDEMNAKMVALGRKVMKPLWKFIDKWTSNIRLGGLTPAGEARHDMILARSGHDGEAFIVLNKSEDIDDTFLSNVPKINRLFNMGWGNIIVADDINRTAYFCMKQYKGTCSILSYVMIYQNFGQLKVYETLEDAKKQSNSIFKIHKQFNKVVSEWVVNYRHSKYLKEG